MIFCMFTSKIDHTERRVQLKGMSTFNDVCRTNKNVHQMDIGAVIVLYNTRQRLQKQPEKIRMTWVAEQKLRGSKLM